MSEKKTLKTGLWTLALSVALFVIAALTAEPVYVFLELAAIMAMIIGSALTLCGIPQPVQQGPGCEDELAEHLHESFRQSLLIKRFKHIWREGNTTS